MPEKVEANPTGFNSIRISIASPDQVRSWSHGEVTKPETINYRTLRPEKDGLFCERIFGPTKDWECFCGKYKRIRFRGVICDRCGVEVTRSKVRRERMAHIDLAAPVAHIWFSKSTPSRLGLLLDLSPRNLERVLYFAQYVIVSVDEDARKRAIEQEKDKTQQEIARREQPAAAQIAQIRQALEVRSSSLTESELEKEKEAVEEAVAEVESKLEEEGLALQRELQDRIDEIEDIQTRKLLTESRYREMRERYGSVFTANMGAEAVLEALKTIDLNALREQLIGEMRSTSGQRRKKAIKRLHVVEAFRKSESKPEWMILTVLPVLPPELRPMVQLDGGRFATSDLNDLYRRVINRNNRLKRLLELRAPDIIVRNEKRMLQEAVDALIDNGRRGRPIQGSHNHKLKSLSDLLRGKQGRFRQNLLGKRVDYSGRSVIVVGPELQFHQCGLPKRMALELFKPFVMHRLVVLGIAPNIKSAKRMVERARPEVWEILEEVIKRRPVLLNRAPTLHRLGIQAFQPILIEGSAIQIHPLVCTAFNADFDGDQMAVHVPLSRMAVLEARKIMLSVYNMLSPASGDPLVAPTLDMVLGCYYLTAERKDAKGEDTRYNDFDEVRVAYDSGVLDVQALIQVRDTQKPGEWLKTTTGRIIFNEVLPAELRFKNCLMDKKALKDLTGECFRALGNEATAATLDKIKALGFYYATRSGMTIAINDIQVPKEKERILADAQAKIEALGDQYQTGLISEEERYQHAVDVWSKASVDMEEAVKKAMPTYGSVAIMAISGAKGNITQIKQMAGMRGLMSNPKGRIIDLPIKSSFREGLSVLEYFISTHGARKGLADTALRTADSGYLTRRLVDICQEVIVLEEDCGSTFGIWVRAPSDTLLGTMKERLLGRRAAAPVAHPETGEILVDRNEYIDEANAKAILDAKIDTVLVRSPLGCEARHGICQACYGISPATGRTAMMGEAVGIIAAQSIGEPGTQLTMRTFHTGGVAGVDITSGLPRVEELFEARIPKGAAVLSDIDGVVEVVEDANGRRLRVVSREEYHEEYPLPKGYELSVSDGQMVDPGAVLAALPAPGETTDGQTPAESRPVVARVGGKVQLDDNKVAILWEETDEREYPVAAVVHLRAQDGQPVKAGDDLTSGPRNPHDILRIKGKEEVVRYLIEQVQTVYRSQGVTINDKHIEVIIGRMLRRVQVDSPGDTDLLPGEFVDRFGFQDQVAKSLAEGGEPATARPVLLGITRSSLLTDSFLSAASFQETTRVLTEAAVQGKVDKLLGLKENVIIGRLIPARFDASQEGRDRLGVAELEAELAAKEQERMLGWLQEDAAKGDGQDKEMEAALSELGVPADEELDEDDELDEAEDASKKGDDKGDKNP
ncbi:MAG: DNA-directed RNA polymerase subunit beta' [Chloroflexota bacterium]|nr:DNA-directed RNA polymerase subunit beta' [Chloroflexota bacterium]